MQVGNIARARDARLFAAETQLTVLLWGVLIGGGLLVLGLLFVVSLKAPPIAQGVLVSLAAVFTIVLLLLVAFLSLPFRGADRLKPEWIQETGHRWRARRLLPPPGCAPSWIRKPARAKCVAGLGGPAKIPFIKRFARSDSPD